MLKKAGWYFLLAGYWLYTALCDVRDALLGKPQVMVIHDVVHAPAIENGDIVNTMQGPVRVLGVDGETVWCEYIILAQSAFKLGLRNPLIMDVQSAIENKVQGVKHSWMQVPS